MEPRLIDANEVRRKIKNSRAIKSVKVESLVFVDCAPTIDPETLPIVRELREELKRERKEKEKIIECINSLSGCGLCKKSIYIEEFSAFIPCRNYCEGKNKVKWIKTPYGETIERCADFEWRGLVAENGTN